MPPEALLYAVSYRVVKNLLRFAYYTGARVAHARRHARACLYVREFVLRMADLRANMYVLCIYVYVCVCVSAVTVGLPCGIVIGCITCRF